jgi:carbon-monoxide dehydrogenase large subunit
MNAVLDALCELGVHHLDMPATPARIWAAIETAKRNGRALETLSPPGRG